MTATDKGDLPGTDPVEVAPRMADLDDLRSAAATCTGCELYAPATQTVFGAGPSSAWLMFVGEQPGDKEDRPAGPTKGSPSRSSLSPGCSPTSITSLRGEPSPKTACVVPL